MKEQSVVYKFTQPFLHDDRNNGDSGYMEVHQMDSEPCFFDPSKSWLRIL